jgi:hypothetical protein
MSSSTGIGRKIQVILSKLKYIGGELTVRVNSVEDVESIGVYIDDYETAEKREFAYTEYPKDLADGLDIIIDQLTNTTDRS